MTSPSGVRGGAPAENGFWRILKATERSFLYLYDKIWGGTICISVPPAPNSGGACLPCPPMIYAHVEDIRLAWPWPLSGLALPWSLHLLQMNTNEYQYKTVSSIVIATYRPWHIIGNSQVTHRCGRSRVEDGLEAQQTSVHK